MDKNQLKQYKSAFHFGASVRYEKILSRGYGEDRVKTYFGTTFNQSTKVWKQKTIPTRTGIVIGWRWLSNGISNYDHEDGNSYTATQSIFAIEVKRGMMNKVDLVSPESLARCKISPETLTYLILLPKLPDRIPTMSDKDKQWLSNEMKSVPRDSNGRWK